MSTSPFAYGHTRDGETELRVVCAWCGEIIKDGPGKTSHGMCDTCELQQVVEHVRETVAHYGTAMCSYGKALAGVGSVVDLGRVKDVAYDKMDLAFRELNETIHELRKGSDV